jgi:hypothetical protein
MPRWKSSLRRFQPSPCHITLEEDANGVPHADPGAYSKKYSGKYEHRAITGGVGHNLPQEAPEEFAKAIIDVDAFSRT